MRKLILLVGALALVLGITQCNKNKQEEPVTPDIHIVQDVDEEP